MLKKENKKKVNYCEFVISIQITTEEAFLRLEPHLRILNVQMRSERLAISMNVFITLNGFQGNSVLLTVRVWISEHIIKRYLLESLPLALKKCACNLFTCHFIYLQQYWNVQYKSSLQGWNTSAVSGGVWNCTALNSYALRKEISKQFTHHFAWL